MDSEGGPSGTSRKGSASARKGKDVIARSSSVGPPENADGSEGCKLLSDQITMHKRSHFFGMR